MREIDDEGLRRARIYVDTRAGALAESGELVQAIAAGVLTPGDLCGELADLARGRIDARRNPQEITLFKSVGTALADLAAAELAVAASDGRDPGAEVRG
jgi:ornithine cyclodeaminase